jgi:hypothetical protein
MGRGSFRLQHAGGLLARDPGQGRKDKDIYPISRKSCAGQAKVHDGAGRLVPVDLFIQAARPIRSRSSMSDRTRLCQHFRRAKY